MKKQILRQLLFCVFLLYIASSCDKYEKWCNKLYGNQTLIKYEVDGIDALDAFVDSLGSNFCFQHDEVNGIHSLLITKSESCVPLTSGYVSCHWKLLDDYETFSIYASYGVVGTGPFGEGKISQWEILNWKDVFKLRTNYNGNEYEIEIELN